MMLLLEDHSDGIPGFLMREANGSFTFPDIIGQRARGRADKKTRRVTAAETREPPYEHAGRRLFPETDEDRRQRAAVQAQADGTSKNLDAAAKARRDAKRLADKEREAQLVENTLSARKTFIKHFKWSFDQ